MKHHPLKITIERESVCGGDDVDAPHSDWIAIGPDSTLADVLQIVQSKRYLAHIDGGKATWIAESDRPLAVVAEQWESPRFLVDPATRFADCAKLEIRCPLYYRYWCQVDPDLVFECLINGSPLPDKYGR